MSKNIVVFSDGTGQDGGARIEARLSNIYKLYRACKIGPDTAVDPARQIAFYDPGLGTDADSHGLGRVGKTLYKWGASLAGRGIGSNIVDCYEFIINHWQPGDRIFLFGFSRGAYTARCVAQVVSLCGIPAHASDERSKAFNRFGRDARQVAERAVHQVYEHGAGFPRETYEAERDELARRFRVEFGSDHDGVSNACPHFIGVFDTVAALGAAGFKRIGLMVGLTLAAATVTAVVSALAGFVPAGVLWRILLAIAVTAILLAKDRPGAAIIAGLTVITVEATAAIMGVAIPLPTSNFWERFVAIAGIAGLTSLIKLQHDSFRYIDDFPSGRKGHHIRWEAANYDRGLSHHVGYARHATAIDETRADFPKVGWGKHDIIRTQDPDEPAPFVQLFFSGNHSDVGGSYPEPESRLSDVPLNWMIEEATTIPNPLLIERSRIQVFPDATGLQHSEPASMRQNFLWWVPKWAPLIFRQGWAEKARTANGFPVHPTVFRRFAAGNVDQYGERRPYRPANLAGDERFSRWFSGKDARLEGLLLSEAGDIYEFGDQRRVPLLLDTPNAELEALMTSNSAASAAGIFPGSATPSPDTVYLDALALRMLRDDLARAHLVSVPIHRISQGTSSTPAGGLLVFGIGQDEADRLACSFGALTLLVTDNLGRTSITPVVS